MKKIQVSNRVFWAAVVLASAALIGHNVGRTAPPIAKEVVAHSFVLVDESGDEVVTLSSPAKAMGTLTVGSKETGYVSMLSSIKSGPVIYVVAKDRNARMIGPKSGQDTYTKLSP